MKVKELMSRPAVTCGSSDNLNTAARLMWEHDCGAIPVVDQDGSMVGMITDRDVCMAAYMKGRALKEISVFDSMSKHVISCHEEDSLDSTERLMGEKQIRRVPVVDSRNNPIGILSLNDIARRVSSLNRTDGREHVVVQTLAAISRSRPDVHDALVGAPDRAILTP